jgi:hypothetical protein
MRVPGLFVTGAPGSGKTALAKEIGELLWRSKQPHAVIDLDELCRGLFPDDSAPGLHVGLAAENLASLWSSFRRRGAQRLIVARIIESVNELAAVEAAVPDCDLVVCRLVVEPAMLEQRLRRREPGSSAAFLTSVSPRIASTIGQLDLPGVSISNDGATSITDLATIVLDRLHWPHPTVAAG